MKKTIRRWISLLLSVLLVLSVAAGAAEEPEDAQRWFDLAMEAYQAGDIETTLEDFRKSADLGNGEALNYLGTMYFYGFGVEPSTEKAIEYFLRGVELGDPASMDWMGSMYQEGTGVEQSDEKAAEYYRMSADLGFFEGQILLGLCYKKGTGVPQSYEKAAEYFRLAADQGEPYGFLNLGSLYENGQGVEQSWEKAAEYYRTAAEQGNAAAQDFLGLLYEQGNGVEQSWEKAAECYRLAADQQYPDSLVHLARLYQEGLGVTQSPGKALELYTLAAQLGSEEAQEALQKLAASDDRGPVQSEGIVIPDCTEGAAGTFDIPETEAMDFVRNLKAGWNLGNTFDAKDDGPGDPNRDYETYWSGARTTRELVHAVREAGFNLFRIPVSWHNHLTDDDFTIDPAWLARVEEVACWALDEGMYVIINIHHDDGAGKDYLYPDTEHYAQSEKYITAIWSQVAEAFAEYDEHVIFESMNEPRLAGTAYEWNPDPSVPEVLDSMQCINRLNRKFVETVRASGGSNASRFLMIPGYCGSWGGACADEFELPADDRIIVEAHAYTPYHYALDTSSPDSSFDLEKDTAKQDEITAFMDNLYRRHISRGVPVILDEFGALKKNDGDLQDRVNYTSFYTAAAGARGIVCVWWDNANYTGGGEKFALIDRNTLTWVYPDIVLAIMKNCVPGTPD